MNIEGYEGIYQIFEDGRVYSNNSNRFLNPTKTGDGYYRIGLYKKGKRKSHGIHHLLAQSYIPNPKNLPYVDHIDKNIINNNLSNLRWITVSGNCRHKKNIKGYTKLPNGKFRATIHINGKDRHLGVYDTEEEAQEVYWCYHQLEIENET